MQRKKLLRSWVRDALALLLHTLSVTALPRRQRNRLTIVTFHRVLPAHQLAEYPIRSIVVTPDELHWFIQALNKHFVCSPLRDAADSWFEEKGPKPPLAITFDDGQLDNYLHARPVLEALGVRATFFVTVCGAASGQLLWPDRMAYAVARLLLSPNRECGGLLEPFGKSLDDEAPGQRDRLASAALAVEIAKRWLPADRLEWLERAQATLGNVAPAWDGMMTAAELKALTDNGHEIGSHSSSHEMLPALSSTQLNQEIVGSKTSLEAMTGRPCVTFCYPNGDYDSRCAQLVRDHYRFGVTTRWGTNDPSADHAILRRLDMVANSTRSRSGNLSMPLLAWRMSGLYPGLDHHS